MTTKYTNGMKFGIKYPNSFLDINEKEEYHE